MLLWETPWLPETSNFWHGIKTDKAIFHPTLTFWLAQEDQILAKTAKPMYCRFRGAGKDNRRVEISHNRPEDPMRTDLLADNLSRRHRHKAHSTNPSYSTTSSTPIHTSTSSTTHRPFHSPPSNCIVAFLQQIPLDTLRPHIRPLFHHEHLQSLQRHL